MGSIPFISSSQIENHLTWTGVTDALSIAHQKFEANIGDILLQLDNDSLLTRAAWIKGYGIATKTATIFPANAINFTDIPTVQSLVTLFDDKSGEPVAILDGNLVTKWKTAGDSILGAKILARKESKTLTILGAGTVAKSMIDAYREIFPNLQTILLWNHQFEKAKRVAAEKNVLPIEDLKAAVEQADIISSATTSRKPFIKGEWLKDGSHVDLIGAFRPDMREAHDSVFARGKIFVDSFKTALHDIGELGIPISKKIIAESDVVSDFYGLCASQHGRESDSEITIFKNGGGAHLDLAVAVYIKKLFDRLQR